MRTKERSNTDIETLRLKQASMMRTLSVAKKAAMQGMLRKRSNSTQAPYKQVLRVKSD